MKECDYNAGTMTQQWTVWCCDCTAWEMISGSKSSAVKEFKQMGWIKQRTTWLCSTCAVLRTKVRDSEPRCLTTREDAKRKP
jgi:hypothetical protein